jgi:hypothetical protein
MTQARPLIQFSGIAAVRHCRRGGLTSSHPKPIALVVGRAGFGSFASSAKEPGPDVIPARRSRWSHLTLLAIVEAASVGGLVGACVPRWP